ncbi:MAG: tetratricopeptide repeat protein [Polyangiaceae bacterium]|nr:tetratricopeptide repeat protein [Polyangiaceae bacterium]MCW5790784.1 tetratricopeptide repeat protein [Polyangiaceae bacterium]
MRWLVAALVAASVWGCAPSFSDGFERSRSAALRAYGAGRYLESAAHWERVAEEAPNARQRYEALYRAAAAYKRGRRHDQARALLTRLLTEAPNTARAPRAAYDLADLQIEMGNEAAGYAQMAQVIERYPAHAASALSRSLTWLEETQGLPAARGWLESQISKHGDGPLGERLHYSYARLLATMGEREQAVRRYLWVADRYPYPKGALWDDSLFHAAELKVELGQPREAIALLERMLREREPSSLSGSYERPRYGESQHRIAVLYRDALNQPMEAARAFRELRLGFPHHVLRDDAAWEEAKIHHARGDRRAACSAMRWLRDNDPKSRYAACAGLVCEDLPPLSQSCRPYIARQLQPEAEAEERP